MLYFQGFDVAGCIPIRCTLDTGGQPCGRRLQGVLVPAEVPPELVDAGQRSNDAVITLCYFEAKEDIHGYF